MKTKYLFIHCEDELSSSTPLYVVLAGTTAQAKRDIEYLQSLNKYKFFFHAWDNATDAFFWKLVKTYGIIEEYIMHYDIRDLVRLIKAKAPLLQNRNLSRQEVHVHLAFNDKAYYNYHYNFNKK